MMLSQDSEPGGWLFMKKRQTKGVEGDGTVPLWKRWSRLMVYYCIATVLVNIYQARA